MAYSTEAIRNALNIVRGAVAKDGALVPTLMHVTFHKGRAVAFDGRVTISTPCPTDLSLTLPGKPLCALFAQVEGEETIIDASGRSGAVCVRVGARQVTFPTGQVVESLTTCPVGAWDGVNSAISRPTAGKRPAPATTTRPKPGKPATGPQAGAQEPTKTPEIVRCNKNEGILDVLRTLRPFVGVDVSGGREWGASVLIAGSLVYATNNVTLIEADWPLKSARRYAIPVTAIDELLRINIEPTHMALDDSAITFLLPDATWIRAQLVDATKWPDVKRVIDAPRAARHMPLPDNLHTVVAELLPFCPDAQLPIVVLHDGMVTTTEGAISGKTTVKGLRVGGKDTALRFYGETLLPVLAVATHMTFGTYPRVGFSAVNDDGSVNVFGVVLGILS